jgi:hypothetical protein
MMKHVHLYYDAKEDELVLAGTDNFAVGYYSIDDPTTAIKALIAETVVNTEWEEERNARKKENRKSARSEE